MRGRSLTVTLMLPFRQDLALGYVNSTMHELGSKPKLARSRFGVQELSFTRGSYWWALTPSGGPTNVLIEVRERQVETEIQITAHLRESAIVGDVIVTVIYAIMMSLPQAMGAEEATVCCASVLVPAIILSWIMSALCGRQTEKKIANHLRKAIRSRNIPLPGERGTPIRIREVYRPVSGRPRLRSDQGARMPCPLTNTPYSDIAHPFDCPSCGRRYERSAARSLTRCVICGNTISP